MAELQDLIEHIENNTKIGIPSKTYKTIGNKPACEIPFNLKPSQQVIAALGGYKEWKPGPLTQRNTIKTSGNSDVSIVSFSALIRSTLIIMGTRIDRLFNSARIYVNTALFPEAQYKTLVQSRALPPYSNAVAGLCHAQEIDLLVDTSLSPSGRAHTTACPDNTQIQKDSPALLLLTTPSIDHGKKDLDSRIKAIQFIFSMYCNIFDAALAEGRKYLLMSAEGLEKQGRAHELYFRVLIEAAKLYPELQIIYNAESYAKNFDEYLKKAKYPINIGRTTKNSVFVAAHLISEGKPCALHNPSSAEVLFGHADVGAYWQSVPASGCTGDNSDKTLQSFLGTVSTAPLGSYGINPEAFDRIIERNLNPDIAHSEIEKKTSCTLPIEKEAEAKDNPVPNMPKAASLASEKDVLATAAAPPSQTTIPQVNKPVPQRRKRPNLFIDTSMGFSSHTPQLPVPTPTIKESSKQKTSCLNENHLAEIDQAIDRLIGEIYSCWPYPDKGLKKIKVEALSALKTYSYTMDVPTAIETLKNKYPKALDGYFSTRTADLLDKLEKAYNVPLASALCT